MSPMCMYSSENGDGQVTNFHLIHYGTRVAGQVGLVMIEATAVLPEGRISNKDLGIWDNSLIEGLHKTTTFIHDNGAKRHSTRSRRKKSRTRNRCVSSFSHSI